MIATLECGILRAEVRVVQIDILRGLLGLDGAAITRQPSASRTLKMLFTWISIGATGLSSNHERGEKVSILRSSFSLPW